MDVAIVHFVVVETAIFVGMNTLYFVYFVVIEIAFFFYKDFVLHIVVDTVYFLDGTDTNYFVDVDIVNFFMVNFTSLAVVKY